MATKTIEVTVSPAVATDPQLTRGRRRHFDYVPEKLIAELTAASPDLDWPLLLLGTGSYVVPIFKNRQLVAVRVTVDHRTWRSGIALSAHEAEAAIDWGYDTETDYRDTDDSLYNSYDNIVNPHVKTIELSGFLYPGQKISSALRDPDAMSVAEMLLQSQIQERGGLWYVDQQAELEIEPFYYGDIKGNTDLSTDFTDMLLEIVQQVIQVSRETIVAVAQRYTEEGQSFPIPFKLLDGNDAQSRMFSLTKAVYARGELEAEGTPSPYEVRGTEPKVLHPLLGNQNLAVAPAVARWLADGTLPPADTKIDIPVRLLKNNDEWLKELRQTIEAELTFPTLATPEVVL